MGKIIRSIVTIITFLLFLNVKLYAEPIISGKVFYNYRALLDTTNYNAFNIERAYLTLSNKVSESVSYKVTYDVGKNDAGSSQTAFLKIAMVKWKTNFADIIIGMQGMNMFKTMENTWGHRFIDKTPMDSYKYSPSADLGIGIVRPFGPISTSALITNGGGYKKAESNSHKKLSIHMVYGESKLNKKDGVNAGLSLSTEPYDKDSLNIENTNVMGIFAGYAGNGFRGGFEFDMRNREDVSGKIFSIYSTYKINEKLSILARLDQVDEDTSEKNDEVRAIITGVHYQAARGLTIALTFRAKAPKDGELENSIVINFQFSI